MLYAFSCKTCGHRQDFVFFASEYDQYVHNENEEVEGCHRIELCEKCRTKTLYRHISVDTMPQVMGGSKGYKSMERYWADNPGLRRQHEDAMAAKMEDRHRKRVLDRINKQIKPSGKSNRHKGYGKGKGETKLNSDD